MEPRDRNSEIYRLWDLAAGYNWIADSPTMLFAALTNVLPKEAHLLQFDGVIPVTFQPAAMLLYQVVADSEELKGLASQRLCAAIEDFLRGVMTEPELAAFKASTPMKSSIVHYKNIFEELEAEGRGDSK